MKILIVLVSTAFVLTGCTNFYPPVSKRYISDNQSYWLNYDASRRGSLVISHDGKIRSCSEPAPDVALSFVNELNASQKAPTGTTGASADATLNATALALAGRNEVVLLARESLFRICEANLNGAISNTDVAKLYELVFDKVLALSKEQATISKSQAKESEINLEKFKLLRNE